MECPVCNVPLIAVEREQVEVDYCISCRGLWFDGGELQVLGEKLGLPLDPAGMFDRPAVTTEKTRSCPRCAKKMLKNERASNRRVITDLCPSGEGVWLDRSELGALLDHIAETRGATRPMARFLGEMFGSRSEA